MKNSFSITRLPFALLLALLAVAHSCKEQPTTTPIEPSSSVSLSVVSVLSNEVWLKLSFADSLEQPRDFRILRNDSVLIRGSLFGKDTLIANFWYTSLLYPGTYLLPNSDYTFSAVRLNEQTGVILDSSKSQHIRTLDTTSHDFQWTTYELGEGTSYLRDVCVINDTCVWAVGQIYLRDSTGNIEYSPHNAAKWNGETWEIMKLRFPLWTSQGVHLLPSEPHAVFGFSPNDMWFSTLGSYLHWNGTTFEPYYFPPESELRGGVKMWGTSSQNLFSVSYNGAICHYDGVSWRRMESGTDVDLRDIHGTPDGKEVWACGFNSASGYTVVLKLEKGAWVIAYRTDNRIFPTPSFSRSIWMDNQRGIIAGGGPTIWQSMVNRLNRFPAANYDGNDFIYNVYAVRGSAHNDIVMVGSLGSFWHWNGFSWQFYSQFLNNHDTYRSVAITSRTVIAVGERPSAASFGRRGLITIGRR